LVKPRSFILPWSVQKAAEDDESADDQGHLRALPWSYEARNRLYFDGSQQTALQLSSTEHAQHIAGGPPCLPPLLHPITKSNTNSHQ
jgi:hypothetical protein